MPQGEVDKEFTTWTWHNQPAVRVVGMIGGVVHWMFFSRDAYEQSEMLRELAISEFDEVLYVEY